MEVELSTNSLLYPPRPRPTQDQQKLQSTMDDSQNLLDSAMMDQKLTAMKNAYAEIIMNTTKEAAVLIMESERKAVRFQQELSALKEESLRMLMTLKQLLDAKSSEAEIASVSQQEKIKELEAQLQEAEEIVTDLRLDLRQVQGEFEQCKINQANAIRNEVGPCESTAVTDELIAISNMKNSTLNDFPDSFASILMRLKEPEQAKNKYVQRIRACRGNLENGDEIQMNKKSSFLEKCSNGLKKKKRKVVVDTSNVLLKYTFQRKRKRESLSKAAQNRDLSNKLTGINNGKKEPEIQTLKAKSSRDSR